MEIMKNEVTIIFKENMLLLACCNSQIIVENFQVDGKTPENDNVRRFGSPTSSSTITSRKNYK